VTEVIRAGERDVPAVADLIADAFHRLDATAWLVPDPVRRRTVLGGQFAILVEHALSYGVVEVLDDRSAAAVWFDNTRPAPPPTDYDARLVAVGGPDTPRLRLLDELFEAHHPRRPHHHLALLAVAPDRQGAGLGTTLLEHHHAVLDQAGIPGYLEASSPGSRDLYGRHGYALGEPFTLPDGSAFWPMWRTPIPVKPA
jgi:GNAT superfamily N-acetyltransferase